MSAKEPSSAAFTHQHRFIEIVKSMVPPHLSLANELSSLLDVSLDSAYRRLRCETEFTLNEVVRICHHFEIPLEALNNEIPNVVTFRFSKQIEDEASFLAYLKSLRDDLEGMAGHENRKVVFAAEDIPVFYHFRFPELSAFKMFYWLKSILNLEHLQKKQFSLELIPAEMLRTGTEIYKYYMQIPSVEVWTEETIMSTLQQIRFYAESGFFHDTDMAMEVIDQLQQQLELLQRMAESGRKLTADGGSTPHSFTLYQSELMIGTNCVLVHAGDRRVSYISYNTFNSMRTNNLQFNQQNERWMNNLLTKSTLLSGAGEKQRNRFFKSLYRKLDELRAVVREGA